MNTKDDSSSLDAALAHVAPDRRRFLGLLLTGVAAAPLLTSAVLAAEAQQVDGKSPVLKANTQDKTSPQFKMGAPLKSNAQDKTSPQLKSGTVLKSNTQDKTSPQFKMGAPLKANTQDKTSPQLKTGTALKSNTQDRTSPQIKGGAQKANTAKTLLKGQDIK